MTPILCQIFISTISFVTIPITALTTASAISPSHYKICTYESSRQLTLLQEFSPRSSCRKLSHKMQQCVTTLYRSIHRSKFTHLPLRHRHVYIPRMYLHHCRPHCIGSIASHRQVSDVGSSSPPEPFYPIHPAPPFLSPCCCHFIISFFLHRSNWCLETSTKVASCLPAGEPTCIKA